jgi:hypothetical protein
MALYYDLKVFKDVYQLIKIQGTVLCIRKITSETPVLLVSRGCFSHCRRASLTRIPRIPKEKLDSCLGRNDK